MALSAKSAPASHAPRGWTGLGSGGGCCGRYPTVAACREETPGSGAIQYILNPRSMALMINLVLSPYCSIIYSETCTINLYVGPDLKKRMFPVEQPCD